MGLILIAHALTAALVFAKIVGATDHSWWVILSPSIAVAVFALAMGVSTAIRAITNDINRKG